MMGMLLCIWFLKATGNKQLLHCVLVHVCFCALAAFNKVRCNHALAQLELTELKVPFKGLKRMLEVLYMFALLWSRVSLAIAKNFNYISEEKRGGIYY